MRRRGLRQRGLLRIARNVLHPGGRAVALLLRHGMSLRTAVLHLQAGEWEEAHDIVQGDASSPLSCWAHGIVHLQQGDVENARYWFKRAKRPFSKDVAAELAALASAVGAGPRSAR